MIKAIGKDEILHNIGTCKNCGKYHISVRYFWGEPEETIKVELEDL